VVKFRTVTFLFALLTASTIALGESPKLDYVFPTGGQRGTQTLLTLGGTFDPWPVKVWLDSPEMTALAETNKGKVTLTISSNAVPGPHLLRVYNDQGASAPRILFVGAVPEIEEKEPNDALPKAQVIANLPVTINGRYDRGGDSDAYKFELAAGKKLVARIYSYSLGSPVDPVLQLVNSNGVPVAFNHDFANLDPLLAWKIESSGTYYLRTMAFSHPAAMNVNFTGSASCVYRLAVTDGPYPYFSEPLGLQRSGTNTIKIHAWNLDAPLCVAMASFAEHGNFATAFLGNFPEAIRFPISSSPEILEQEPNNAISEAQQINPPTAITGQLNSFADVDYFGFQAKKEQSFACSVLSATLGFPLNGVIRISSKDGKEVAKSDIHTEAREPTLTWKASEEGQFFVSINDLRRISGTNLFYRLSVSPGDPDFTLLADQDSFVLDAGKTNELKLRIERKFGFNEKLRIEIQNLSSGVSVVQNEISGSENSPTILLSVPADAASFSGPIQIRATSEKKEHPISHAALFNIRGADEEQAGNFAIDTTDLLWLTIKKK
jgi:hypothetical protein